MLRAKPISNVIDIVVEVGSFETKIKTKTLFFSRPRSRQAIFQDQCPEAMTFTK